VSRWWNEPAYARWLRLLAEGRAPVVGREILGDHQRRLEHIYLGLRTSEGVVLPEPLGGPVRQKLERWVAAGWAMLQVQDDRRPSVVEVPGAAPSGARSAAAEAPVRLRLTPQGWLRLDELVATF
jgi:coproporphyrinogen III oxidase-like Fe-S oxidoreductase